MDMSADGGDIATGDATALNGVGGEEATKVLFRSLALPFPLIVHTLKIRDS